MITLLYITSGKRFKEFIQLTLQEAFSILPTLLHPVVLIELVLSIIG